MCYSAQVVADFKQYTRLGGTLDIHAFAQLFADRGHRGDIGQVIPKAVRDALARGVGGPEDAVLRDALTAAYRAAAAVIEAKIAELTTKLLTAEAVLTSAKPTKKAANDHRVAGNKRRAEEAKLAELQAASREDGLARIWPGHYLPVLIRDPVSGQRKVVPMRYRARPVGWSAADEKKRPNCYNARQDSLRTVWRGLFGHTHGVVLATRFYESVALHDWQRRPLVPGEKAQSVEVAFAPEPVQEMLLACIWRYVEPEGADPGFYSVAIITREPPPEVRAAGHDRCVIALRPEHLDAWLAPDPAHLAASLAILDDPIDAVYQPTLITPTDPEDAAPAAD